MNNARSDQELYNSLRQRRLAAGDNTSLNISIFIRDDCGSDASLTYPVYPGIDTYIFHLASV